jgi:hypothetical protein
VPITTIVTESNQVSIQPEIARDFDIRPEETILVTPLPSRGELARQLMGTGKCLLKPGADPSAI